MFLESRLLSACPNAVGILLAAAFAIGLGVGTSIGPVTASRSNVPLPSPIVPAVQSATARMAHPAEVLRIIDGDTFEARVNLWPGLDVTTRVRLRGIDAPELKARCGEERIKAEAARRASRHPRPG
jgi:endonuclease YncB( thermonuclease family)